MLYWHMLSPITCCKYLVVFSYQWRKFAIRGGTLIRSSNLFEEVDFSWSFIVWYVFFHLLVLCDCILLAMNYVYRSILVFLTSDYKSISFVICASTFLNLFILICANTHLFFCPCPFIEKNCLLWSVLKYVEIYFLWFVPTYTKFLSLSFHRKKLSLVICADTSWTLIILICANIHQVFILVLS